MSPDIRSLPTIYVWTDSTNTSFEMYYAPPLASAAMMAASSVFQRSSWKLFHDTPTISCAAETVMVESDSPATASDVIRTFLTVALPYAGAIAQPKRTYTDTR